jgi:hypothetical protein
MDSGVGWGVDSRVDDGRTSTTCSVLTQTGCQAGQKCTWVVDQMMTGMDPVGHIDCVPDGTIAVGGACTRGAPGPMGYDNCKAGGYCESMKCEQICDLQGGAPMCPTSFTCKNYSGVFGPVNQPVAAGLCDPNCDPLADNKFGSGKTKTGTGCTASQGCYGYPNSSVPTEYTCNTEFENTLYHRSPCNATNGCANGTQVYLNGCAQGFIPLLYHDDSGSMTIDCISYCAPVDCYHGHCGTNSANLIGAAPHRCNSTDSSGSFNTASATNNGDQCTYMWYLEFDGTANMVVRNAQTDKIGFCYDHSKYRYDSNNDMVPDAPLPRCDTFTTPGFGTGSAVGGVCNATNGCLGAADFGCVSTTTGGVPFEGKVRRSGMAALIEVPRLPYDPAVAPKL